LRAIILIALVGHAAAAAVTCVTDLLDADNEAAAACVNIDNAEVTECWTLFPTDSGTITRGCGGAAQCAESGCVICTGDACNLKESIKMCWVGTVIAGVVDGAAERCTAAGVTKCFTKPMTDKTKETEKRGCGDCVAETGYTCSTVAAEKECVAEADGEGCNIPIQTCFKGTITGDVENSGQCPGTFTCFTRTKTDDKSVDYGCGECVKGTDYTCGAEANCKTITKDGCNEPPRFQCLQNADWKVDDTTTVATDCAKLFTQTSCSKIVKDDGTIKKACGACSDKAVKGETCYQCDETGCNSASGLFSVLALSMAVIYQLA